MNSFSAYQESIEKSLCLSMLLHSLVHRMSVFKECAVLMYSMAEAVILIPFLNTDLTLPLLTISVGLG